MADPKPKLAIIGSGGHARVVAEAARLNGFEIAGHIAPDPSDHALLGAHLGGDEDVAALTEAGLKLAIGLGFATGKGAQFRAALLNGFDETHLQTIVHPNAIVSPSATLAPGAFVAAGAVVGVCARVGSAAIVNTSAVVDHDCDIGNGAHVAINATLAGNVTLGASSLVGAGAVLRQGITIGENAVIAAGAVVLSDLGSHGVAKGVPAVHTEGHA